MSAPLTDAELYALAEQRRQEQAVEYGQYVASQDIYHDRVLAYVKGAPVPASNVAQYAYDQNGMVEKVPQEPPGDQPAPPTESPSKRKGSSSAATESEG